ncbi:hypothetical protein C6W19_15715 [Bacillus sp. RJGP41]|nr:hypothetical protein C6W19_15715 [Bacillus sp. RJGP41]
MIDLLITIHTLDFFHLVLYGSGNDRRDNHSKLSRRAVGFRASVFRWLKQLEENGVDALETDKKGRPTSYISYTKL